MRGLLIATVIVAVLGGGSGSAEAQLTGTLNYEVDIQSNYFDDCDFGFPCFVVWCGVFDGEMTLEYTGFDGVFDNYDVSVVWNNYLSLCPATPTGTPELFTGTGTFQINRDPVPAQQMILSLTREFGPPSELDSGLIVPTTPFPSFEDFQLISGPETSETFNLFASLGAGSPYIRGDSNGDGAMDVADAVFVLSSLFVPGSPAPECDSATDVNDDGSRDVADAVYTLSALFVVGSPQPPSPYPGCDIDPTPDSLGCGSYTACP